MGKVIKVDDNFYDQLQELAKERGISLGEAVKIAGQKIPPPSECEVAQFQKEVTEKRLPPQDPKWIFPFIDGLAPEVLKGLPTLSAYADIITKARGICPVAQEIEKQLAEQPGPSLEEEAAAEVTEKAPEEQPEEAQIVTKEAEEQT